MRMDYMGAIAPGVIRSFGPFAYRNGFMGAIAPGVIRPFGSFDERPVLEYIIVSVKTDPFLEFKCS